MNFGQFAAKAKKRATQVAADSCLELSARVHDDTPVDTGLLENSWTPDINNHNLSNAGGSIPSVTKQLKAGDRYTFVNAQPYVRIIEYTGHSPKAPNGMLNINTANWSAIVKGVIRGS